MRLDKGHCVGFVIRGSEVDLFPGKQATRGVGAATTVEVVGVAEQAVTLKQDDVAQVVVVTPSV